MRRSAPAETEILLRGTARRRDRLHLSLGGFRMVELNVVGWSALIATGLALGAIAWLLTGLRPLFALPAGVVVTWLVVLGLDYRRWRRSSTSIGCGGMTEAQADEIVTRLNQRGVDATYGFDELEDEDPGGIRLHITCRQPYAKRVWATIEEVMDSAP